MIRRLERGLYDRPGRNRLTGQMSVPDYRRVIEAVARRDQTRMLVDGMTAANDLGLSDAVPGRIVVHTDARLRPIKLGKQIIAFRPTAPSKLFWADRPAMRVVQALHWLREALADPDDRRRILGGCAQFLPTKIRDLPSPPISPRVCQPCRAGCRISCGRWWRMMPPAKCSRTGKAHGGKGRDGRSTTHCRPHARPQCVRATRDTEPGRR